ncbi:sigma-70 family RNA polymerase sigma factor [Aeromicrobium terrae]|uniref:Sigma-70 family RNA polymerase sigma factor n=1 Tax=Aeromicrobium terrae TaxID=2498846 RepID=A0A5C8NK75_9ACTN|nr:sigma-70 family RNA polymerase sigma factor [Aeromicrobium terrae]TXL61221.1 sigma-70 family RNA polymerase sigma factor [Aeromicrobium terrae]
MTATGADPTDAELVERVLAADREAFAVVYDRYGPRLFDFAYSMLRHREDASDAVADSFVLFAERLPQLREPDRLRPWLYAIVRSECLRRLKARKRVAFGGEEQLIEMADDSSTPDQVAEQQALRQLVWDASAGLAERDRALLDLHLRQGLEGAELGEAMGVSASNAYVMLNRLRGQVDRSLGALLIARLGRDDCDELDALLADWDGGFSPLIRKRVARHVDGCDVCGERRRKIVSPWMLLASVPIFAAPIGLRDRVVNDTQLVAYTVPAGSTGASPLGALGKGRVLAAVGTAAAVIAVVVALLLWPGGDEEPTAQPVTGTPTATPEPTPTPSDTAEPSPSPSTSAGPGFLVLSTRSADLGRRGSRATFRLTNTGGEPVTYRATSSVGWLATSPPSATIDAGESAFLTVTANRGAVDEGRSTGTIQLTWDAGSTSATVSLVEERAPQVGRPVIPSAPSCTVPVTAKVSDESGLRSVTLVWTGGRSGRDAMSRQGSSWAGVMGTFDQQATVSVHVQATDRRGNTARGPSVTVTVNPCPL